VKSFDHLMILNKIFLYIEMTTSEEFRVFGRAMIDYVADYLENIRDRKVLPDVKPGKAPLIFFEFFR